MGEHKQNIVATYFAKHLRARHLPLSLQGLKRRPKATPIKFPEGRYIVKNTDPFSCHHFGENLLMGEEDEEDYWMDTQWEQAKAKKNMNTVPGPGMAQNPIVNASRTTISGRSEDRAAPTSRRLCLCCTKGFRAIRTKQRFCSSRCRLLYWAAGEILREYSAGNASGLRDILERLRNCINFTG